MKTTIKKIKLTIIVFLFTILMIVMVEPYNVFAAEYQFSESTCVQAILNHTGDKLYISYFEDNEILEIDVATMQEIRQFDVVAPGLMALSPSETYLYSTSTQWPFSQLVRINLLNSQTTAIDINGDIVGFTLDANGDWIWAIHETYPIPNEFCSRDEAVLDYKNSGFLTKIDASSFSQSNTVNTSVLPMDVLYSNYSGNVLVSHEWELSYAESEGSFIDVFDATSLQEVGFTFGGNHNFRSMPTKGCEWSTDGRYFAIPNSYFDNLTHSLRILDTADNKTEFELTFLYPIASTPIRLNFVQKAANADILWCASNKRYVVRVNTITNEYEVYEIPEATSPFGFFDVSPDGRTLYLTQYLTGNIIVTSPGNHDPICNLLVITPRPHTGPSPVAVEFDASGTYDDDGDTLTFHWDFDGDKVFDEPIDDAYTGTPSNPTHEYTADYEGAVNLRVTDNYQGECDIAVILSVDVE